VVVAFGDVLDGSGHIAVVDRGVDGNSRERRAAVASANKSANSSWNRPLLQVIEPTQLAA